MLAKDMSSDRTFILVMLLFAFGNGYNVTENNTHHHLYNELFANYNKNLRPVHHPNDRTNVTVDAVLAGLEEVNERQETIELYQWFHMNWKDEFLIWDPDQYQGVQELHVLTNKIWMPDIIAHGMTNQFESPPKEHTFCNLHYNGTIHCGLNQILKAHCAFNISMYPFDTQTCTLTYYCWNHNAAEVLLVTDNPDGNTNFFQKNTEWDLMSYTNRYRTSQYTRALYAEVLYSLEIKRKPLYYFLTLIFPCYVMTTLSLVGLFTPFNAAGERQEKVSMGLTTLLTMAVLLLVVSEQMPKTSKGFPAIGIFMLFEIMMASVATCTTVIVMKLQKRASLGQPIPTWLSKVTMIKDEEESKFHAEQFQYAKNIIGQNNFRRESMMVLNADDSKSDTSPHPRVRLLSANYNQPIHTKMSLGSEASHTLEQCLKQLLILRSVVEQKEQHEKLIVLWTRVCDRLDLILLIIFNFVNTGLAIVVFVLSLR